ncbi:GNAT family N-acetyltransferase [Salisediminibacterium beveridgei]|uniref:Acetyltransferase, GNAT family n=1 Tax=Salisediminibacterium beveridgei TaxID=632773 RepID=A0A1D7QYV9_9BACI|nr:GNAT family N-acetyltransferase [Salisediminibacterium beveridgei]AOM84189.1 Acetyltransferase, GNAT family [Salisediminibacterium beveridgei]
MKIREVEVTDTEKLAFLTQKVDESSQYMLWEAGERQIKNENQLKMISSMKEAGNSTLLVAEEDDDLFGYLLAIGGKARRNRHSAYVVVGVLKGFRGKGIGTKLFEQLEKWALSNHISRLELTVVTKNEEGLRLYKKSGFDIEGTKRNSLRINGDFVDEYYMSKLL